jgi:hypothetical protein
MQENDEIDISAARWVLVIEKEVGYPRSMYEVSRLTAHPRRFFIDSCGAIITTKQLLAKGFS